MLDETVVPGPLLEYKNTLRLARGDDLRYLWFYVPQLHTDAAINAPRRAWLTQGGLARGGPFLARSRFWVARGVSGVEEVKRRGSPPLQRSRALSNFANGTSRDPILNARQRIGLGVSLPI